MTISLWRQVALASMDPELLTVIIQIVREFVEYWGRYPTAAEVQAQLHEQ